MSPVRNAPELSNETRVDEEQRWICRGHAHATLEVRRKLPDLRDGDRKCFIIIQCHTPVCVKSIICGPLMTSIIFAVVWGIACSVVLERGMYSVVLQCMSRPTVGGHIWNNPFQRQKSLSQVTIQIQLLFIESTCFALCFFRVIRTLKSCD